MKWLILAAMGLLTVALILSGPAEAASVKDFGAVGDGIANDTAAIQAAINAAGGAGGGVVTIPAGVYMVDPIGLRTGVALVGDGIGASVLRMRPSAVQSNDTIHILDVERVTIRMLTVDVDATQQLTQGAEGTRGIQIGTSSLVVVEGVEVSRSGGAGIKVSTGTDIKITNCTVLWAGVTGIHSPGIEVGATDGITRDVLVANNRVAKSASHGIHVRAGGTIGRTKGVAITGNVITDNNQINLGKGAITVTLQSENITVAGNIISLDPTKPASLGLTVQSWFSGILVNNNIVDTTHGSQSGITVQDIAGGIARGVIVSGNVVRGPGLFGIQVSPNTSVSVMGNDFTAMPTLTRALFHAPQAPGLYVTGNAGL